MGISDDGIIRQLLSRGYLSVEMFFVMSGFVMAYVYREYWQEGWSLKRFGIFMQHRFARIYPLYFVLTIAMLGFLYMGYGHTEILDENIPIMIGANVLMIQQLGISESIIGTAWTISVDLIGYLLFPALSVIILRTRANIDWFVIAAGIAVMGMLQIMSDGMEVRGTLDIVSHDTPIPIIRCLTTFIMGMSMYKLYANGEGKNLSHPVISLTLLAMMFFLMIASPKADFLIVGLVPAFLLSVSGDTGFVARILGSKPMLELGKISYALYLMHLFFFPFRMALKWQLEHRIGMSDIAAANASMSATIILLIGCSFVAHYFFERPTQRWLRQFKAPQFLSVNKHLSAGKI